MAVTSIWPIKGRVDRVINYAQNPEKTTERAEPYRHGEDTRSIASIRLDPELLKQTAGSGPDAIKHHRFVVFTEEEAEDYIKNNGGTAT